MTPEEIKERSNKAIAELKTKLNNLEIEYNNLRANNLAAWDMYGSELCAGDMEGQENRLLIEISKLGKQIKLLSGFIQFGFSGADLENAISNDIKRIQSNKAEIKKLQESIKYFEQCVADYKLIKELLGIE